MSAITHGMDVAGVRDLSRTLKGSAGKLDAARREVEAALGRTNWTGRDADEFRTAWRGQIRHRLTEASRSLDRQAVELGRQADDQERASNDTGGGLLGSGPRLPGLPGLPTPPRLPTPGEFADWLGDRWDDGSAWVGDRVNDVVDWGQDRWHDVQNGWNDLSADVQRRYDAFLDGLGPVREAWDVYLANLSEPFRQGTFPTPIEMLASAALIPITTGGALANVIAGRDLNIFDDGSPKTDGVPTQINNAVVPRDFNSLTDATMDAYNKDTVVVTVIRNPGEEPRYLVTIPGTQADIFSADGWTDKPHGRDWAANIWAMASGTSSGQESIQYAINEAIAADRAAHGETDAGPANVLLTGHSQGGILAANLAADPAFHHQYNVEGVIAYAAPVENARVPSSTPVLSIEHSPFSITDPRTWLNGDLVPRLDGGGQVWPFSEEPADFTQVALGDRGGLWDMRPNHEQLGYSEDVAAIMANPADPRHAQIADYLQRTGADQYYVGENGTSTSYTVPTGKEVN